MKVEGAHTFSASREEVWKLLLDPQVIAKTMPGATDMKLIVQHQVELASKFTPKLKMILWVLSRALMTSSQELL